MITKFTKFNEELTHEDIDLEYIDMCFINFIDNGFKFKFIKKNSDQKNDLYELKINLRKKHTLWEPNNIDDYIELSNKMQKIFTEIKECIKKVKIQYPDLEYTTLISGKNDKIVVIYELK